MKRIFVTAVAAVICVAGAGPAAAKKHHASSGPGLAETLDFIRDKVAEQGQIFYTSNMHDSATGQGSTNQFSVEASAVTVDPTTCELDFHWHTITNGGVTFDGAVGVNFRTVLTTVVTNMEADLNKMDAKAGHPTYSSTVNPSIWVVSSHHADGDDSALDFREQDLANRVATAIHHAVKLCGAGNAEPF